MVLKTHLTLDRGDLGLATYADKAADDIISGFQKAVSSSGLLSSQSFSSGDDDDYPADEATRDAGGDIQLQTNREIEVGDFVQWESQGSLQFEAPRRVRWISDDKSHLAVDGSDTGIPVAQVSIEEQPADTGQGKLHVPPPQTPPTEQQSPEAVVAPDQRKAVFPVSDGDVTFIFPSGLTIDGIEELEAYLAVFLKKEKRLASEA